MTKPLPTSQQIDRLERTAWFYGSVSAATLPVHDWPIAFVVGSYGGLPMVASPFISREDLRASEHHFQQWVPVGEGLNLPPDKRYAEVR